MKKGTLFRFKNCYSLPGYLLDNPFNGFAVYKKRPILLSEGDILMYLGQKVAPNFCVLLQVLFGNEVGWIDREQMGTEVTDEEG